MAGGKGTRLWPITQGLNKHFLPIYDKPMIYYSLSTVMLAGIRSIMIICDEVSINQYRKLLSDGSQWGLEISYKVQIEPDGLPSGLVLAREFIAGEKVLFMLGDNLLIGNFAGRFFQTFTNQVGAMIFTKAVNNPSDFGVITYSEEQEIISIEEKPEYPTSNEAITGIYFMDETILDKTSSLKKSKRGEFEIVDVLRAYNEERKLFATRLPIGTVWLDTGSVEGLSEASEYVRIVQNRQSIMISCPEAIALQNSWISEEQFTKSVNSMPSSHYKTSLLSAKIPSHIMTQSGL